MYEKKAHALMILWAIIIGLSFPIVANISSELSPMVMTSVRFLIAAVTMLPWALKSPDKNKMTKETIRCYVPLGCCLAIFFYTMFYAAAITPAINLSVIYLSVPILCLILSVPLGVEKFKFKQLTLLIIGTIGAILLVMSTKNSTLPIKNIQLSIDEGEGMFLIGCLMMAMYPVLSKRYIIKGKIPANPLLTTFWSLLIGGAVIGIIALVTNAQQWPHFFQNAQFTDYLWIIYLAVFSSFLTFLIMQKATLTLNPTQITAYNFIVPIIPLILLWINQIPKINWAIITGIMLVSFAIFSLVKSTSKVNV